MTVVQDNTCHRILVVGSARRLNREAREASRIVGRDLAVHGFGLITGSWPGVDAFTTRSFRNALMREGYDVANRYLQVDYPRLFPFSRRPVKERGLRLKVANGEAAYDELLQRCAAAILIQGVGGVRDVADVMMDSGRTVLPLPLTGGHALEAYGRILASWSEHPVAGLTKGQFMSLSLPLRRRTTPLVHLLTAAMVSRFEIFVSYRRDDIPGTAGRLASELWEYFGPNRVFLDTKSIGPGWRFDSRIQSAVNDCRVAICVIGPRWDLVRLSNENDFVRLEVSGALKAGKTVVPVVAFGGSLPEKSQLPPELRPMLDRQAVFINGNQDWQSGMTILVEELARILTSQS